MRILSYRSLDFGFIRASLSFLDKIDCKLYLSLFSFLNLIFDSNDQGKVKIINYFRTRYGIPLQYPFLPAIVSGGTAKAPAYMPVEVSWLFSFFVSFHYVSKFQSTSAALIVHCGEVVASSSSLYGKRTRGLLSGVRDCTAFGDRSVRTR